jgi:hypothetical protein
VFEHLTKAKGYFPICCGDTCSVWRLSKKFHNSIWGFIHWGLGHRPRPQAENSGSIPVARSKGFWGCPSRVNRYQDKPFGQI